jgi:hypothetical protein
MSRKFLFLLFSLAALSVSLLSVDLPSAWRGWRYSRAILATPLDVHDPMILNLPWDIYAHSYSRGADFRIITENGKEVPFFLSSSSGGETKTETLPSRILERSFLPGKFTQIVIRVTDKPPLDESHGAALQQLQSEPWFNAYRVSTPDTDFMYWVETAVSDDAHEWRIIDARSPISRFRKHGLDGNQTVQIEGYSNQRFLRLRIMSLERQFPIDDVQVLSQYSSEPPRSSIPGTFVPDVSPDPMESRWVSDLATNNLPVSELDLSTEQPEFYRAVRVSTSEDNKEWNYTHGGEIYRFYVGQKLKESQRLVFPETFARFWRVEIVNANDRPLANARMTLSGLPRAIIFPVDPGHRCRFLYGNAKANTPQYDFGRTSGGSEKKVLLVAQLSSEEFTSNYVDPRPYTERHPNLLWFALVAAVALLGYAALRALRTPTSPEEAK